MESKLAVKQTAIDNLVIKCDNNEQYSKGSCVHIHGLDFKSDEDDAMEKVARCYRDMGKEFNQNEIDCAHCNGKSFIGKEKKKKRSIIIKDTHRKKASSTETPALTKSTNMGTWVVGTTKLFISGS